MKFYFEHPDTVDNPKTFLTRDHDRGASSLIVKNTASFTTAKFIVAGNIGFENAEIVRPQTITAPDTLLVTPSTKFGHNGDSPITLIEYDKIKVYRSTAGINGTYNLLETIDIAIDADSTYYLDSSGRASYYYKFTYYNSNDTTESDYSDPIAGTGLVFHSLKTLIDRVFSLSGDGKKRLATANEIQNALNEFYTEVQADVAVATRRVDIETQDIPLSPDTDEYDLSANFLVEKGVKLSLDSGSTFNTPVPMYQLDSQGFVEQSYTKYAYLIVNNKIKLDKKPSSGEILRVFYVKATSTLNNQTDTLANLYINHTGMFVKHGVAYCYLKRGERDMYNDLKTDVRISKEAFIKWVKRISNNHPQYGEIAGQN